MKPIIRVENISKRYAIGPRSTPYSTFREALYQVARSPASLFPGRKRSDAESFWALRDVSFEIMPGEVTGIIGRNGAGKSTLLKILARVTEPTSGRVELYGRTNSLLEVGTGFHPELTGRENIFVNGAILGLKRSEIKRLFDEIVAFAQIEEFLDTPVKHYSSGMYMRLAFSVAAHLLSEILIIDEVLAVGDVQFQKRCLGKMQEVARSGRTVIFVSHNLAAVESLCETGVLLEEGRMTFDGSQTQAIAHYLESVDGKLGMDLTERRDRTGSGEIRITSVSVKDLKGNRLHSVISGQDVDIHFNYRTTPAYRCSDPVMGFMVRTQLDVPVFLQHNRLTRNRWDSIPPAGAFVCRIRKLPLPPSNYRLGLSLMCEGEYLDRVDDAIELTVLEGDFFGTGEVPPVSHGCCLVDAQWSLRESDE